MKYGETTAPEIETVATAIVGAAARRRKRLVLSPVGKASLWLSRLAPDLYERIMRAKVG